jgi:hypothetical protein
MDYLLAGAKDQFGSINSWLSRPMPDHVATGIGDLDGCHAVRAI